MYRHLHNPVLLICKTRLIKFFTFLDSVRCLGKRCRKKFKRDLNAFYWCWINLSLASDKSEIVRTKIPYLRILCSFYFVKSLWVLFLCQWNEEQKQPSRDVLRKRCSENMQQIYTRAAMPSVISIKLQSKTNLLKSHFSMGVLLQICCIFSEHLFLRPPLDCCFWR